MVIIPIRHVLRLRSTRRLKGGNHGLPSSRAFIKKSSPVSSKRGFLLPSLQSEGHLPLHQLSGKMTELVRGQRLQPHLQPAGRGSPRVAANY